MEIFIVVASGRTSDIRVIVVGGVLLLLLVAQGRVWRGGFFCVTERQFPA